MYKLYDILTEAKKIDIQDIVDYINQFDSFQEFKYSDINKFNSYQQNIINNYKNDPKYNWNTLVAPLKKKDQERIDAEDTKIISDLYPEYNFDNATYYYKKISDKDKKSGERDVKYLNGLYCPKIDFLTKKVHGYSNDLRVKDLKRHIITGCRKCAEDKKKYDIAKEIKAVSKETGYKFDKAEFYYDTIGKGKKLFVKNVICPKHDGDVVFYEDGKPWEWLKIDKGYGCPICAPDGKSKGEKKVYKELQRLGYNNIITEKTFPGANGCYGFKGQDHCDLLRYDAYIEKNGEPICIEYDGKLHYEASERYGGKEALEATQERDRRKTEYCEKNGIKLIRIPYWDYDRIGKILEEKIGPNDKISEIQRLQKLAGISEIKIEPQVFEPIKGYEDEFEKAGFYFDEGILGGVGSGAHGYYDAVSDRISGRYLNEFNEDEFDKWYDNFNINDVKSFTYPNKESVETNTSINMDQLLSTLEPGMYDLGERLGYIKLGKNGSITKYAMPSLVSDSGDNYMRMFKLDSLGRVRPKMDKEKIKNILQKNLQDPGDWFIL